MKYPFIYGDFLVYVETPMALAGELKTEMEAAGWHRVYEAPQFFVRPGWAEAMEESEAVATDNDRRALRGRAEAARTIAEAAREG